MNIPLKHCLTGCLGWLGAVAQACTVLPLVDPAPGTVVNAAQPALTWADADRVRLQVAWVVPESGLWRVDDLWVEGGRWKVPEHLAPAFLAVKVRISRGCPDDTATADLLALGPAFVVDRRAACALDRRSLRRDGAWLRWQALPQATSYRVRRWSADGWRPGAPLLPREVRDTAEPGWGWAETALSSADVVTVQAVCGAMTGPPVAWDRR